MRLTIFILVLLPVLCAAQENLVPNGSFEEYSDCPSSSNPWPLAEWSRTTATPDYFNACVSGNNEGSFLDTPCNNRGCQEPKSGDAYVGFFPFALNGPDASEYVQVGLIQPLSYRIRYLVEFYVSPAENYGYAVGTIGAALTFEPPDTIVVGWHTGLLDTVPQVLNHNGPITDTAIWTLISDTIVSPTGGERYISIGNFHLDADSDTLHFNPDAPQERAAYYYIDDVSVIALDSVPNGITEQETLGFDVWPNPATDVVRFRVGDSSARSSVGMTVRVLDAVGRLCGGQFPLAKGVSATGGRGISGEVDISTLPTGIYFLELTDEEGKRAVRKFVKQ